MAVLTTAQRDKVWRVLMRLPRSVIGSVGYLKAPARTAVDNADDWCETNAAAYNTALTAQFRTTATTEQKSILLALVALERAGQLDKLINALQGGQ
jgi:hypothetical protein